MICQHTVGYTKHEISPSFPVFRYCSCKIFTIWCLMTPNDLLSQLKTIGFLYSMWYSNRPNIRSCLRYHVYKVFTIWPLMTFDLHQKQYCSCTQCGTPTVHTKYEICPSFPSWDIVFTRHLQCFHNLTPVDPKWPLTSTKNNRLLVLNVALLHTKYEICPSFPSWDIVFTRFSQFDPCWPLMTFDLHQKQ